MILPLLLVCSSCLSAPAETMVPRVPTEADQVVVVINANSEESTEIGAHYRERRDVPKGNVLVTRTVTSDNIPYSEYYEQIEKPLKALIQGKKINYVVTTKGVPIRVDDDGGCSVDAFLACMNLPYRTISEFTEAGIKKNLNPYYGKDEPFDSSKFKGMLLVTRLDGPNAVAAKRLVDLSLSAKADKGPFFFDQAANRNDGGYKVLNEALSLASKSLSTRGFQTALEATSSFAAPEEPLMGYCSWGSNDDRFNRSTYNQLKFKPGALAETFVSTSGRTFSRVEGGQSLITDLIQQGVTGVKGYVSEPYTFALARPEILFDRYTKGRNLAESFYAASLVLKWKDVVIGDPLCRPFKD